MFHPKMGWMFFFCLTLSPSVASLLRSDRQVQNLGFIGGCKFPLENSPGKSVVANIEQSKS